jgi:pilus assembly protein CpaB
MKKSTIALFFAIALSVLAVIAVRRYLVQKTEDIEKGTQTVKILVAAALIKPGDRLSENQVRTFEIALKTYLPEFILATDRKQFLGQKAVKEVRRDRALLKQYFREEIRERVVIITPGRRIATVSVNPVSGIAGLITPGDHVDVLVTFRGGGQGGATSTMTLFQDVTVFAVDDITRVAYRIGRNRSGRGSSYATVTLLLLPAEVELLVYAQANGEMTLTKRAPVDSATRRLAGVDPSSFPGLMDEAHRLRSGK